MNFEHLLLAFNFVSIIAGAIIAVCIDVSPWLGAACGCLVGASPMIILCVICVGIMWWCPDLPRCKCGQTKYGEYEYVDPMEFSEDMWYEYRCPKCGRRYKSKRGILVECRGNGITVPFMKHSRWGRWQVDDGE